jgi:hypothetical protein
VRGDNAYPFKPLIERSTHTTRQIFADWLLVAEDKHAGDASVYYIVQR